MGKGDSKTGIGWKSFVRTIGAMADDRVVVFATCDHYCCPARPIDLAPLIARVGRDYSLINRRCRCRLTPGCGGWNRFGYSNGAWVWHLYDDATAARWTNEDRREKIADAVRRAERDRAALNRAKQQR